MASAPFDAKRADLVDVDEHAHRSFGIPIAVVVVPGVVMAVVVAIVVAVVIPAVVMTGIPSVIGPQAGGSGENEGGRQCRQNNFM